VKIGEPAALPLAGLLDHTNVLVRYLAATSLGEIGPPAKAAAPALRKRMLDAAEDGSVRIETACALCRVGENVPEATKVIEGALDGKGARYAVEAISRMGPAGERLVPLALAKLADADPYARLAAVRLVAALEPEAAAKAVPALAALVDDDQPVIRRQMALVLAKLGPAAAPAAAAIGRVLLGEADPTVREEYVEALIAMGPGAKPAAAVLVRLFDDTDLAPAVRLRVLVAAAAADPANPTVAAVVVKAASDRDEYARAAAATALGKLDPLTPDALSALLKLAKTDSRHVARAAAVRALAEAGPRAKSARPDLESLARTGAPGVRLWAKVALAAVDGDVQAAAGAVRAGLSDPDVQVRQAAAEALLLLGPLPTDLPPLSALLKEPVGREAAARALGRLGPAAKEAVPRLTDLLDDRDSRVRIAAAEALGMIGAPAALPAVPKLREVMRDPLVESTARRALEKLGVKETGRRK
jgi:HEAT repeat protein